MNDELHERLEKAKCAAMDADGKPPHRRPPKAAYVLADEILDMAKTAEGLTR